MTVATNAGNRFYISKTPANPTTWDGAGYAALSYDEVGEVTDAGTLSAEYNITEHNTVNERDIKKLKGSRDNGAQDYTLGFDDLDAGQITMQTARDSDSDYHIKIALKSGGFFYYSGLVTKFNIVFGAADDVVGAETSIVINKRAIYVPAP